MVCVFYKISKMHIICSVHKLDDHLKCVTVLTVEKTRIIFLETAKVTQMYVHVVHIILLFSMGPSTNIC